MRQHRALGPPGGARGVEHRRQIVRPAVRRARSCPAAPPPASARLPLPSAFSVSSCAPCAAATGASAASRAPDRRQERAAWHCRGNSPARPAYRRCSAAGTPRPARPPRHRPPAPRATWPPAPRSGRPAAPRRRAAHGPPATSARKAPPRCAVRQDQERLAAGSGANSASNSGLAMASCNRPFGTAGRGSSQGNDCFEPPAGTVSRRAANRPARRKLLNALGETHASSLAKSG